VLGDAYTIVDMAVWGWARMVPFVLGEDAFADLPNVKRHLDAINARPAAQAAEALKTRHAFKGEMDTQARTFMFPAAERAA
jgi:GST-like protein